MKIRKFKIKDLIKRSYHLKITYMEQIARTYWLHNIKKEHNK